MGKNDLQPGVGGGAGHAGRGAESALAWIDVPHRLVGVKQQRQPSLPQEPGHLLQPVDIIGRIARRQLAAAPHPGVQTAPQLSTRARLRRRHAGQPGQTLRPRSNRPQDVVVHLAAETLVAKRESKNHGCGDPRPVHLGDDVLSGGHPRPGITVQSREALVSGAIRFPLLDHFRGKDVHVGIHPGGLSPMPVGPARVYAIRRGAVRLGASLRRRVYALVAGPAHRRYQTAAVRRMVSTNSS